MQIGTARAIDGTGVLPGQREHVPRAARRILEIDVSQPLPAAAQPDDGVAELGAPVHHRLDHGVEAGHIAAAREDPYTLRRHAHTSGRSNMTRLHGSNPMQPATPDLLPS